MPSLPTECPACREQLEVARLTCSSCTVQLNGRFELPELLRLGREDLEFVLDFVRCSGSLKDLCQLRGLSYPTIRNRLNDVVSKLSADKETLETKRRKILNAIAEGTLTVKEATQKLKELAT